MAGASTSPDSELRLVVVLTRHGVRSPLQTNETLGKYAAEPWPAWNVAPGILTPHGRQQMVMMGGYYRARYVADGLLSGDATKDAPLVFFRSDNDQRTMESSVALAEGLLNGVPAPDLHALPDGRIDPLFRPVQAKTAVPDREFAIAAVQGRIGGDPANVVQAFRADFVALENVLLGPGSTPAAGTISLLDLTSRVVPGTYDHTVGINGPLQIAEQITDALLLEYTEGRPMPEVGWGRLNAATLTQVLKLHSLYFELTAATFYPAQVQASNYADHLLKTIEQAVSGQTVKGAFGSPAQKLIVVSGHDTNIINFGGMLDAKWWLPGAQENPVLPGGAFVVELCRRPADGVWVVRSYYASQTLDQIRDLTPLSLEHPPGLAPIFIPGCSEGGSGFDVPLEKFEALLHRVIDPKFVTPGTP